MKTMVQAGRRWLLAGVMGVSLALVGCETIHTTGGGTVGVQRDQVMLVSAQEVNQASARQYREMMDEARKENKLNRNSAQVSRVRSITNRLIPQTAAFRNDAPDWDWEINVIQSDDLNAWAMAGGKMAINSGLIEQLELTDAEIAAVLGHEMAHALREHTRERMSRTAATGIGVSMAGVILGVGAGGQDMMNQVAHVTFVLPHSRLHETEADRIGVELAARAGYDPRAAVTLWDKMSTRSAGSPPEWLSTHPAHANRQRELANTAEQVMPLYREAR